MVDPVPVVPIDLPARLAALEAKLDGLLVLAKESEAARAALRKEVDPFLAQLKEKFVDKKSGKLKLSLW